MIRLGFNDFAFKHWVRVVEEEQSRLFKTLGEL